MAARSYSTVTNRGHDDHGHDHHVHPIRMYVFAAMTLTVLMLATILLSYVNFGNVWINNLIALGIAASKTIVVVLWFMHVKFSTPLTKLFAALGFIWATLLGVILMDYFFRGYEPVSSWSGPETALPRKIGSTDHRPLSRDEQNIQNRLPKYLGN